MKDGVGFSFEAEADPPVRSRPGPGGPRRVELGSPVHVPGTAWQASIDEALAAASRALALQQQADGCFRYDLEADCTISAEYILMMHFMAEIDAPLQSRIAAHLRAHQGPDDGWPLYFGGALDLSCTVKCYWALKLAGDDPAAPHMVRARAAILAQGGAARANVFTRIAMALFGQVPWRAVPYLPPEILLLPRWSPFHLSRVSYWSRTVVVPLTVLYSLKARAQNPTGRDIRELFVVPAEEERDYFPVRSPMNRFFLALERTVRAFEPLIPGPVRRLALRQAEEWIVARLNGVDGLGGIFPAIVNAYEALRLLGHGPDDPLSRQCRAALQGLIVDGPDSAWCQPCHSPVWDTGLACLAMQEVQRVQPREETQRSVRRALAWLEPRQILEGPADWRDQRPDLAPGGWAFQYNNSYYPDLDDTAVVAWAMADEDRPRFGRAIARAADWIRGMQSRNGGFAAFDTNNTRDYLNEIPFADHGAFLDPPTADVSARCVTLLARLGRGEDHAALSSAIAYLLREQEPEGGWFGRWGTNYVYGTWSVLTALEYVEHPRKEECVRRAVRWLYRVQRPDGSWGEGNDTYFHPERAGQGRTGTAFQTAWALLGLFAAGERDNLAIRRAVAYLLRAQRADGLWSDEEYTAPGFPRVFYLRYHGYSRYFPTWALARYWRALQD